MRSRFLLSNSEMATFLGISLSTLKRLREAKLLRAGKHYLPVGIGKKRPILKWDPASTEEALLLRSRRVARP